VARILDRGIEERIISVNVVKTSIFVVVNREQALVSYDHKSHRITT
jgi:hypothetical protein